MRGPAARFTDTLKAYSVREQGTLTVGLPSLLKSWEPRSSAGCPSGVALAEAHLDIVTLSPHERLAGLQRGLDQALFWAAILTWLALCFPVERDADQALWLWQKGSGALFALQLLAGGVFLGMSRLTQWSRLSRSLVALGALFIWTIALALEPRTWGAQLSLFPPSLQGQWPLFELTLALAAAVLLYRSVPSRPERPAQALALLCAVLCVTLYLWPHASGQLLTALLRDLLALFSVDPSQLSAILTRLTLCALPAWASLCALGAARASSGRLPVSAAGWLITIPVVGLVALGLKGAAIFGHDALAWIGVRSALHLLSALLVGAFCIRSVLVQLFEAGQPPGLLRDDILRRAPEGGPELDRALRPYRASVHRLVQSRLQERPNVLGPPVPPWVHGLAKGRRIEQGLALVALLTASVLLVGPARQSARSWPLRAPKPWTVALYETRLPHLGIAAGQVGDYGPEVLQEAIEGAAQQAPDLRLKREIQALGALLHAPGKNRRAMLKRSESINEIARELGLPYYLDLNIMGYRSRSAAARWLFFAKTYRIDRVRTGTRGNHSANALWVERADSTNVVEQRLGWTKHDQPQGMIVLNVIRAYWQEDLAPILAGHPNASALGEQYVKHAQLIERELIAAVRARLPPHERAQLSARWKAALDKTHPEHASAFTWLSPKVISTLARKVEVHELQHVFDGSELPAPEPLLLRMQGHERSSVQFAAGELSAYLAEIVYSELPRLALLHFIAISNSGGPEFFAAEVALEALASGEKGGADRLFELPAGVLRARARGAYERLFRRSLSPIEVSEEGS